VHAGDGPGYTYDRKNHYAATAVEPPRRIDYIFVRGPDRWYRGETLQARLAFDTAEYRSDESDGATPLWPSDHFGLVADITVEKRGA
jgi:hypothetical protein